MDTFPRINESSIIFMVVVTGLLEFISKLLTFVEFNFKNPTFFENLCTFSTFQQHETSWKNADFT